MTAATGYTQIHGPRPKDRTTKAEPLTPLSKQAAQIATVIRHYNDGGHCPHWTRGRYIERHTAPGP